jgi:hypothetical protein
MHCRSHFLYEVPAAFLTQKISNSRLVQVYMSKQPGMDTQKVLEYQYITAETLYKTYIREANDVVKLPTRQMSLSKTQKMSGGSRIFRGASALGWSPTVIRLRFFDASATASKDFLSHFILARIAACTPC